MAARAVPGIEPTLKPRYKDPVNARLQAPAPRTYKGARTREAPSSAPPHIFFFGPDSPRATAHQPRARRRDVSEHRVPCFRGFGHGEHD